MLGRPGCKISKVQPNAIYMDLSAFARIEIDVKVFCPNSSVTFHLIQSGQTPTVETIRISNVSRFAAMGENEYYVFPPLNLRHLGRS